MMSRPFGDRIIYVTISTSSSRTIAVISHAVVRGQSDTAVIMDVRLSFRLAVPITLLRLVAVDYDGQTDHRSVYGE